MTKEEELKVGDWVRIESKDGFNGSTGTIDYIAKGKPEFGDGVLASAPAEEYGEFYHVFFGMFYGSRKVVPFKRHELVKISQDVPEHFGSPDWTYHPKSGGNDE